MAKQIVIVGGGAGGAELACSLGRRRKRRGWEITLIDRAVDHLWKPRLHEVAVGLLDSNEDGGSFPTLAARNGFRFRLGALTSVDAQSRSVTIGAIPAEHGGELLPARTISYDTLVLAFGSEVNDFGTPGVKEHCHMLDSAEQALALKQRLLEIAVRMANGEMAELRIGIVGAGATGVELAAEMHHAINRLRRFGDIYRHGRVRIVLVEKAQRVLAGSDDAVAAYALQTLRKLGIETRLGATVERVTADALHLSGAETIPCDVMVWTSGVIGLELATALQGLKTDRQRRIVCDDMLRCEGQPDIYVLGDCASMASSAGGKGLPPTAQVAHQQAIYLDRALSRASRGRPLRPFRYRPRGSLVNLGARQTAGEIPGRSGAIILRGLLPQMLYRLLKLAHESALRGWPRTAALAVADRLQQRATLPVKLHE